jgi:hypothetical protein
LTMRGMFLLCLTVVGAGLVYVIALGVLHR